MTQEKQKPEKSDLRVRRTQKMLQEALIDLIGERSFDSINVGDIAERAMVNRATFYRHYQDKYDLMEKIFTELIEQMVVSIGKPSFPVRLVSLDRPSPHWVRIFEHIGQNHRLYEAMLGPRGNHWFVARLRKQIVEILLEREWARQKARAEKGLDGPQNEGIDAPIDFVVTSVANILLGSITWWLENGRIYTPEQMALWITRFTAHGYLYAIGSSQYPEYQIE